MKLLPALTTFALLTAMAAPASAAKKKKTHHHHRAPATEAQSTPEAPAAREMHETSGASDEPDAFEAPATPAPVPAKPSKPAAKAAAGKNGGAEGSSMDFNFFADSPGPSGPAGVDVSPEALELKHSGETRRWMLTTHQTLGIATWILMAATVTIGQLNYNQLYGGGGGSTKWQNPHEYLVAATTAAFVATGAFALFAPSPYKKPLRFDTGLVHRLAVAGATLGMLTEVFLGWWTTHQANSGNPNNLRTMARTHQVVGWSTFGFLTVAGAVWIF